MNKQLKKKILLTLLGLAAAGLSYTPRQQQKAFREIGKLWKENINGKELKSQTDSLYRSKLIHRKNNKDGTITLFLTNKGKMKALTYKFEELKLKREKWDGKWRMIFFDIPEKQRFARDVLRDKIKKMGFYELQKSVFIFPYECENEIQFVIEIYGIIKWTRFAVIEKIDNDIYLKNFFGIK
jgi:CRISPR/Cas system-associated endoribonuclease Cas2